MDFLLSALGLFCYHHTGARMNPFLFWYIWKPGLAFWINILWDNGQWSSIVFLVDASDSCMFLRKPSKIKFPLPTGVTLIHHADNSFTSYSVFTLFRFSLYLSWFTYQINYLFKHPCIRLCFYDNPNENEWVDLRWSKGEGEKIAWAEESEMT